ncbi:Wzz/FepE/Etk N-terminal domain-containing protein [Chitiniphilus purpureus]|uniref:Wzz/FepE/Etk N-terminal domain-containing protein n=1 Tax=Chitiniphilus purpureus TaxID=2981137 RepID=A0ABY6DLY0_9NEIS|nr:Wzz/FepE/Etk N-terminal domain-containing protein [Chitiniphilus sp. CD1]UXY14486.1 Wzz/FepE/Etk N-terminal domain-containing protein [Chitiniphilus sp. CD1]
MTTDPTAMDEKQVQAKAMSTEVSVFAVCSTLWPYRRVIAGVGALAAVVAIIYALLQPNVYSAKTTIMPPQQQQSAAAAILAQLGGLAAGASIGLKNPNDLYVSVLKSRRVMGKIAKQFGLQARYKTETRDETLRRLELVTDIASGKDGLITIQVTDKDAKQAAAIANAYVSGLREVTGFLAVSSAAQRRLFYEQQLKATKNRLASAEVALTNIQAKTGILELEAQGRATLEAVAALRAEIASREVKLSMMRQAFTNENPELQRELASVAELRGQLAQLLGRYPDHDMAILPRSAVPKAGLEYIRALREVKYNELLLETLAKQFEIARLDEANEGVLVQVIDTALPPEKKSGPRRALIVIFSTILAVVLACGFILGRASWLEYNQLRKA